ncbi:Protein of unknown function [Salinihabitans flavidus]|uniref:Beta-barrel assembly machine subunit BamF n=2 Tax=Salinihabitans flavidus TaxID=569882 RepID=A0A1H8S262_9RHOB|nr:Protein of unknown function [Salinihabitans flavidus]
MVMSRAVILVLVLTLAACGDEGLRQLSHDGNGPDEFRILPRKPIEQPESYAALPTPTPGGSNRTDQNPLGDAAAALGGSAQAREPGPGVARADSGLVQYTTRYGMTDDIRQALAEEDADFRRRRARFTTIRLVRTDHYNRAYRRMHLDAFRELERWRRAGAKTPSAPPRRR